MPDAIQRRAAHLARTQPPTVSRPIEATVVHEHRVVIEDNRGFTRAMWLTLGAHILIWLTLVGFEMWVIAKMVGG